MTHTGNAVERHVGKDKEISSCGLNVCLSCSNQQSNSINQAEYLSLSRFNAEMTESEC